jgi:WD40 repeat protein
MDTREKSLEERIIHAPSQSLSVRSAALVARGLRDLARNSNWLVKKVFSGRSSHLSISPAGQVCMVSPHVRHGAQRVTLYNVDAVNSSPLALSPLAEPGQCSPDLPAAFAWSPTARYLVAALGAWQPELHLFDLQGKTPLDSFGKFSVFPNFLAWSDAGGLFAAVSGAGKEASLSLWNVSCKGAPLSGAATNTVGTVKGIERQTYEAEFGEDGAFSGYGKPAFSPNEESLAAVLEFKGDWADDSLLITDVPSLQERNIFQAQGHITDLTWTPEGEQLIYCTGGQAYRLTTGTMTSEEMPFGAELCACHPFLPLCVCFSSWLKNSATGRLYLFDLGRMEILDECAAEGIAALRWSGDGSKAYAMTEDGLAYIYESPVL